MRAYERFWDRPLGGIDRTGEIPHLVGNLLYGVLQFLCVVLFRYRVSGRERLEGVGGGLVVANHSSYLDPVFLYCALRPRRWVRFMARESLFPGGGGLLGFLASRAGAFPVKRDSADKAAIKRASRMLRNGELVGIFPEGTRRGRGTAELRLHSGAAFIARMGKAPLIPCGLVNVGEIKRSGERLRFPRVEVRFGDPIDLARFDCFPKEERLDAAIWHTMRESFALVQGVPAEQVDMAALFPDSKDYSAVPATA